MANNGFKKLSKPEKYVTGRVILQFSNLNTPYKHTEKSEPKYTITVLIPKDNKDEISNLKTLINKHWKLGKIKNGNINPLKNGTDLVEEKTEDGKEIDPITANFYQFKTASKFRPKIIDAKKLKFTGEENELRGYWCRLSVDFYAFKTGSNSGVTSFFKGCQVIAPSEVEIPGGDVTNDFDEEDTEDVGTDLDKNIEDI
jgi:hypothetical protein